MMMRRRRWRGRGGMRRICRTAWWWRRACWSSSPRSLLPLFHLLLQGYFQNEEVKQPHRRDTQRPNIMNYLPLAILPCLPEQCIHCGKNFSRKSSMSKNILVVHGASRPSKILQDRYLAKLMAHRRISFAIC